MKGDMLLKGKRKNEILNMLEVPKEINSYNTKITILGFDEILIENYKGILEYEEFYIKINTEIGEVNINGFNLSLKQITDDDILIKGKIESIDLERNN